MLKKLLFLAFLTTILIGFGGLVMAAPAPQQRIEQPIIINGQQVQGATVVTNGAVQGYTCSNPQQYVAADQSSSGWACYDETTGTWLLHAQPPQAAGTYDQSQVYYPNTTQAYDYYPYPYAYPYGYYPYPYYGYYGPSFAFGFGFGGHGFHGDHNHFFAGPGPVGHGFAGNGSFGHMGGGHMGGGGAHFGGGGGGGGHGGGHR